MINIHINGEATTLCKTSTMADALEQYVEAKSTFAAALNGEFVARDDYNHTQLKSGDSIDVMLPIQGG
ncbi:sulfur carrier protein ThiS [Thalassotalea agarivorans]|uniref:Sulfur carrier protein n=1 Tax=Thalassotalea agarivorans TaxID=349064 RepID=A0A1I0CX08_THASX|nr:sulfur carrier protein ThiS [Thalassotalea agarivorans]SET23664.1 sulfur carrier protein [Thalassotalea agarivorans]